MSDRRGDLVDHRWPNGTLVEHLGRRYRIVGRVSDAAYWHFHGSNSGSPREFYCFFDAERPTRTELTDLSRMVGHPVHHCAWCDDPTVGLLTLGVPDDNQPDE